MDYAQYRVMDYSTGELPVPEFESEHLNPLQRGSREQLSTGVLLDIWTPILKGTTFGEYEDSDLVQALTRVDYATVQGGVFEG